MKLNAHAFALSAAISMGVVYIICAWLMSLWPTPTLQLHADIMHMRNLEFVTPYFQVTWKNFASGLTQLFIYTYFFSYLMAIIYNHFIRRHG